MTRHHLDAPEALTNGTWQPDRRGVLRWVPTPPLTMVRRDLSMLVVCPFCRAPIGETCHTRNGKRCEPHSVRIIARRCRCGSRLRRATRTLCEECRAAARRETWRLNKRRYRAMKGEVA